MTGSTIVDISDIENLDSDTDTSDDEEQHLKYANFIGVQQFKTVELQKNCPTNYWYMCILRNGTAITQW